jgi:hypothetical protein
MAQTGEKSSVLGSRGLSLTWKTNKLKRYQSSIISVSTPSHFLPFPEQMKGKQAEKGEGKKGRGGGGKKGKELLEI